MMCCHHLCRQSSHPSSYQQLLDEHLEKVEPDSYPITLEWVSIYAGLWGDFQDPRCYSYSFLLFIFLLDPSTWEKGKVSLIFEKGKWLFTLFNTSVKRFKTNYLKVVIKQTGWSKFYADNSQPKFPFCWMENPRKLTSRA